MLIFKYAKYLIKRRFHSLVATNVMCPWSFTSLTSLNCFLSQFGYLNLISTNDMCCRSLTSFNYFFKPIRASWSNFYQLHVLLLTLRTHDVMIFGGMNGKFTSESFFWKWISCAKGENDEMTVSNALYTLYDTADDQTYFWCCSFYEYILSQTQ